MMYQNAAFRLIRLLTIATASLVMLGCGQGSGPEPVAGTPQPPLTGVLIDSPVEGVAWESSGGTSGVTNALGEFQYLPLETITFSVGDIVLGAVNGGPIVTVVQLTNSPNPATPAATNQLVFLQSIDADGDPTNGIQVSAATVSAAAGKSIDFTADDFTTRMTTLLAEIVGPDAVLVSDAEALNHFYTTYVAMGGTPVLGFNFPGYPEVGVDVFELVFADEFDSGDMPATENWTIETGYGPNNDGWGNNEWQLYTTSPDNVRVEDGNLVIQARCETPPCGSRDGTITSGKINSLNKFNFKFGKVVARIKPPVGTGAWPAFWALGANHPVVGWPLSGEIDFMEMHNAFSNERTTHSTLHWCEDSIQAPAACSFPEGWVFDSQNRTFATSLGDDFHVWEADWDEDGITMSLDGTPVYSRDIDPVNMDEFLKEFYMILNVAMGGTLGSNNQPPSGAETFPQTMLVDYVRVFQKVGSGSVSSQTIDFEEAPENYDFGPSGGFGGGAAAVIPNPVSEGINTSDQVGRMLKFEGEVFAGSQLALPTPIAIPSGGTFTMKVWSPREVPVLFKLEGATEAERSITHTGSGWETLTFDFSSFNGAADFITLIFDLGTVGDATNDPDNWTFYFDDIVFSPASGGGGTPGGSVDFPVTFEEGAETYNFGPSGGFGGGASAVIPNPVPEGINTSSQVARMLKFEGEVFAGSLLELPSPLEVAPNSTFTMKVWSPRPVMVLFKLEGDNDAELDVAHGGTGWEELTYDFGSYSGPVQGLTFIFDLGVVGGATADPDNWTFYFDDITYTPGEDDGGDPGGDPSDFGGDFEDSTAAYDFGAEGGFGGGAAEVLANPVSEGINTSAQVVRMLKFSGEVFAGSKWSLPSALDVEAGSMFTLKVWSPRPVMVLLKLEGAVEAELDVAHGGTGWEVLTYDFSNFSGAVDGFSFIFDLGTVGDAMNDPDNWTFYFDDLTLIPPDAGGPVGGLNQIDLPITFDDAGVDYTVVDFGSPVAAMTSLVADPDDANNMVASTIKPLGAPVWAGTTMSTTAGFANAIPFTVNDTTIGIRVYSPDAGIPVRLKAENAIGGNVAVEAEALTTVANEWETLIIDFANQVDGTPALDPSASYKALSVFFNFGTSGDDAGEKTYLWDDVEFNPEPPADTLAPTLTSVSISSDNANAALAKPGDTVTVSITADEAIMAPAVVIAGASADTVTGQDTQWQATRTLGAADSEGALTFSVSYADLANNAGVVATASFDSSAVVFDATSPALTISGLAAQITSLDATSVTFQFSEDVSGFEIGDIVVTNGTASALVSTDAATYTAAITPAADGDLSVGVAANAAQDAAGNQSDAAATIAATVDTVVPSVSISGVPTDFATLDPVTVTFEFSEVVTGFELADVQVTNGVADMFMAVDGDTYTVVVTPDGAGDLGVSVAAGAFEDSVGNVNVAAVDAVSLVDAVAPTLTIAGVPADFATLAPVSVTFQFSESVTGFDAADIDVTNGSASGFVAVDGDTYTADVTPDGAGDLTVAVAAGAASDGVGNPSAAAADVTSAIDAVAPTLTITGAPAEFTTLAAFAVTIQFSEAVTGFDVGDIAVANGAASGFVATDDDTYSANITPTGAGDLTINVAAGAAEDGVGNASAAATEVVVTNNLDTEAPLLTLISIASNNANTAVATAGDVVSITMTANEAILSPVVTINGVAADAVTGSGANWEASRTMLAGDTEGDVTFTIDFEDGDNNAGPQSTVTTDATGVTFDVTAPTVMINGLPAMFDMLDPIATTFQFSEDVTGFDAGDVSVTNGAVSAFASVDASTYTANITPDGNGSMTVAIAAGAAADLAGIASAMPADVVVSNDVDVDAPTLTAVSIASNNANTAVAATGDVVTLSLTADEAITQPVITIGGAAADAITGSGTTWEATRTLLATDAEGTVAFTIDFADLVANDGVRVVATTDTSSVTFDRTAPDVAITGLAATFTSLDPIAVTFTFSEDVTDFVLGDVTVTNGAADSLVAVDASTYTTNVTPDGSGDLTVAVAMDVASDAAGNTNSAASESSTEDLPPAWSLIWMDSFDGAALDAANWTARTDVDCPDPCSGQQSYNTNNVTVAGGMLSIEAQENAGPAYVSGLIDSRGKLEIKYGRVEIDARMPGTLGSAPSLMMLPASDVYGAWPLSGEVDIVNAPDLVGGNAAVEQALSYGLPVPEETQTTGSYDSPSAPETNFITYAVEWEEGEIRWFVDDVHVLTQSQDNWYTYNEDTDGVYALGAGASPFDEDFYLALSLAVNDNADVTSTFPQLLEIDEVRVYECANATDPAAGTGCSTGDVAVTPVVAPDSPFTASLDLYVDGLETVAFEDEAMMTTNSELVAATNASDGSVVVTSDTAAADPEGGTVWNLDITAATGVGDALVQPAIFADMVPSFDLTGSGTAGELLFRMRVNSVTGTPVLSVGLDDSASGSGQADLVYTADGQWQQYSVKIADIVTDSVSNATALDLADVYNVFRLSVSGGSAILDIDDIEVKVACRDTNGCEVSPKLAEVPADIRYMQDFETLGMGSSVIGDLWRYFITVFEGANPEFSYNGLAPNGPQISAIAENQGGVDQGVQQLSIYSDYECCSGGFGHQSTTGVGIVDTSVFREETLVADDIGKTIKFSFDIKGGNIEGSSEASAFIKVLDPANGFSETIIDNVDLSNPPVDWSFEELEIVIGDWAGQILQYGFNTRAGDFEGSGVFYDNVLVVDEAP